MFAGLDAPSHWLVLIAIGAVFFGYKRLPDAARSLGRSLRVFKAEISDTKAALADSPQDAAVEAEAVAESAG